MMKRFFVVVALGLSAMACGNECDDAVDHAEECGIDLPDDVDTSECDGANECAAKCINDASCDELKDPENTSVFECIVACS
jgi:hypothetical protein